MAVDAGPFGAGIVGQETGPERFQVALFDAQHVPHFVGGLDQAVAHIVVDAVGRYDPVEGRIADRFFSEAGGQAEAKRIAGFRGHQLLPSFHRETHLGAVCLEQMGFTPLNLKSQRVCALDAEVQRSDVHGECDVCVVGE